MGLTDLQSSTGSKQQPHNARKESHDQPRRDSLSMVAQLSEGDTSDNDDVGKLASRDSKKNRPQTGSGRVQQSILQEKWQFMFERLVSFKERHGHCLVPNRYRDHHALGAWVSTQRRQYKILVSGSSASTPMTPERAAQLEAIGFVWATTDPRHIPWQNRFEELCRFREQHGHCLVPIGYKKNIQLSNWVSTQRQEYKLLIDGRPSRLTDERIKKLSDIGFIWEARRGGPPGPRVKDDDAQPCDNAKPPAAEGKPKAAKATACIQRKRKAREASDYMEQARKLMMAPVPTVTEDWHRPGQMEQARKLMASVLTDDSIGGVPMNGKPRLSPHQPTTLALPLAPGLNVAAAALSNSSTTSTLGSSSHSQAQPFPLPQSGLWQHSTQRLTGVNGVATEADLAYLTDHDPFLSAVQDAVYFQQMRQQAQSVYAEKARVLAMAQALMAQHHAISAQQMATDLAERSILLSHFQAELLRGRTSARPFPAIGASFLGHEYTDSADASDNYFADSVMSSFVVDGVSHANMPVVGVDDFDEDDEDTLGVKPAAAKTSTTSSPTSPK